MGKIFDIATDTKGFLKEAAGDLTHAVDGIGVKAGDNVKMTSFVTEGLGR